MVQWKQWHSKTVLPENYIYAHIHTYMYYSHSVWARFVRALFCCCYDISSLSLDILGPRQNGRHFADDIFKCILLNESFFLFKIFLKFVPEGPSHTIPALVQIMAWRRPGDKPLSEPMMVNLLTHITSLGLNELMKHFLFIPALLYELQPTVMEQILF